MPRRIEYVCASDDARWVQTGPRTWEQDWPPGRIKVKPKKNWPKMKAYVLAERGDAEIPA